VSRRDLLSQRQFAEGLADLIKILPADAFARDAAPASDSADLEATYHAALQAIDKARRRPALRAALTEQLEALQLLHHELTERRLLYQIQTHERTLDAIERLGAIETSHELISAIGAELNYCTGLERAAISAVRDSRLHALTVFWEGNELAAEEFKTRLRQLQPELAAGNIETEVLRRGRAVIVPDVRNEPRFARGVVEAVGTTSCVGAPIISEGRPIGLIFADCHVHHRDVDGLDLKALSMFARQSGFLLDRLALRQRLRTQLEYLRHAEEQLACPLHDRILADEHPEPNARPGHLSHPGTDEIPTRDLLTKRELEVLALIAAGHTNHSIAQKLIVSDETIKAHTKHILQKLRASNRTQAVGRYLSTLESPPTEHAQTAPARPVRDYSTMMSRNENLRGPTR
jgi:DNA-binding CsgD family transcriptional regulator